MGGQLGYVLGWVQCEFIVRKAVYVPAGLLTAAEVAGGFEQALAPAAPVVASDHHSCGPDQQGLVHWLLSARHSRGGRPSKRREWDGCDVAGPSTVRRPRKATHGVRMLIY